MLAKIVYECADETMINTELEITVNHFLTIFRDLAKQIQFANTILLQFANTILLHFIFDEEANDTQ